MSTHCLEGKIITAIQIAGDKKAIRFLLAEGDPIVAKADGDCCSDSWIENIELPAGGFPAKVLKLLDIELPGSQNDDSEYDCLQVYGFEILTDKGHITIDYRNSSNGYYGGELVWPGELFYGGVWGQNITTENWQDPIEDCK